jgi:hypothetical protein
VLLHGFRENVLGFRARYVEFHERCAANAICAPGAQVVHDHNVASLFLQEPYNVGPNVACSTGYEYCHDFTSRLGFRVCHTP